MRALLLVIAGLLVSTTAMAEEPCFEGVSDTTAHALFDHVRASLDAGCALESLKTEKDRITLTFEQGGRALPPLVLKLKPCPRPPAVRDAFEAETPAELSAACPRVAKDWSEAGSIVSVPSEAPATPRRIALVGSMIAWGVIAAVALWLVVRRVRSDGLARDSRWLALFAFALAIRLAVTPSLANWYADVLPATGDPSSMRFGPVSFGLAAILRVMGLWSEPALFRANIIAGVIAVLGLVALLRELHAPEPVSWGAGVFASISPLHARLSASSSDHVLGSALIAVAVWAWVRAFRRRDPRLVACSLLLVPMVVATRADLALQVALVPLWTLLRDREERSEKPWRAPYMAFAVVFGLTVIAGASLVSSSGHPLPEWSAIARSSWVSITQFATLASKEPGWITWPWIALFVLGLWSMRARPWLLVRVVLVSWIAFTALGRTIEGDALVGARYFAWLLLVLSIPPAFGVAWLASRLPARPLRTAAWTLALASCLFASKASYVARYAFQDEYAFLRGAVTQLPVGCTVYAVDARPAGLDYDVDCCLDPARSPLTLVRPDLRFASVAEAVRPGPGACAAYYEGAACSLEANHAGRHGELAQRIFSKACADARALGALEPLSAAEVSPRSTDGWFQAAPRVVLHRLR